MEFGNGIHILSNLSKSVWILYVHIVHNLTFVGKLFASIKYMIFHEAGIPVRDLEVAKKILNSSSWPDRVTSNYFMHLIAYNKPLGLIFGCGETYRKTKKLAVRLLHQLDFFKTDKIEKFSSLEISELCDKLEKKIVEKGANNSLVVKPHKLFQAHALSIIWQVIVGTRFDSKNPILNNFLKMVMDGAKKYTSGHTGSDAKSPLVRFFNRIRCFHLAYVSHMETYSIFKRIIAEKRKRREFMIEMADFTDGFLQELDSLRGADANLADENLLVCLKDFVIAGSETSTSVIEFALLYIALNPDVQRKLHEEVDRVIGKYGTPSYEHKPKMVYTTATLLEVLRFGSVLSPGTRIAKEDNEINGILYRKGTVAVIKSFDIHHSKELWGDPHLFKPERFISEEGTLINQTKIIPFGYGKRFCIGENVAQISMFIFLTTLLQRFNFEIPPEHPPSLKTTGGVTRCPVPYYLRISSRHAE